MNVDFQENEVMPLLHGSLQLYVLLYIWKMLISTLFKGEESLRKWLFCTFIYKLIIMDDSSLKFPVRSNYILCYISCRLVLKNSRKVLCQCYPRLLRNLIAQMMKWTIHRVGILNNFKKKLFVIFNIDVVEIQACLDKYIC